MRKSLIYILFCFCIFNCNASEIIKLRDSIKKSSDKHNVNPILVEAIIRHESAHGTSNAAKNKNNLAGIMRKNKLKTFETKEDCIEQLAQTLAIYKQNGRISLAAIGKKYASDPSWAKKVQIHIDNINNGKYEITK